VGAEEALKLPSAEAMHLDQFVAECMALPGAEETTPFGPLVIVYKVGGKMFATAVPEEIPHRVNLKCDPDRSLELRDRHDGIQPGFHMNKKHWNTLTLTELPTPLVTQLILHSYQLVFDFLPKKVREEIGAP
jgi:predicted DNA-binding protein (MmcQ/YjbR family)